MTPWQRLEDWLMSDNTPEMNHPDYITAKLQERWPGNYRVVKQWNPKSRNDWYGIEYVIKFDTPAEETMFRLKYSK